MSTASSIAETQHPRLVAGGAPVSAHTARRCPDWPGLWDDATEVDLVVDDVEGRVPPGLRGTLYRNGPGRRSLAATFFDGDGMIRALRFSADGKLHYRSRFVRTPKYLAEIGKSAPQLRTAGTQRPGGALKNAFRMPATDSNTHVIAWREQLLSLHEGGVPFRIDPRSLATLGPESFDGRLPARTPFSAHPHHDPSTGETFNFGLTFGKRGAALRVFKLTRDGALERVGTLPIPFMTFMHDFALTERWCVFWLSPIKLELLPFLLGTKSTFDSFVHVPELGSKILLLSRDGREQRSFDVDPWVVAHTVAAREQGDALVLDLVEAPDWTSLKTELAHYRDSALTVFARTRLRRARLDMRTGRLTKETLYDSCCDFPRVDPRRPEHAARFTYLTCTAAPSVPGLWTSIVRVDLVSGDLERFDMGPGYVVQEPVFVPDPSSTDEQAGWLLSYAYNVARQKTDVLIFDARQLSAGPVATLALPVNTGMTFHGSWVAHGA